MELCILGKDITLDMVQCLTSMVLLGMFEYISLYRSDIFYWITWEWKPLMNNIPRVIMLINGWLYLHFLSKEIVLFVQSHYWFMGMESSILYLWESTFKPWMKKDYSPPFMGFIARLAPSLLELLGIYGYW